jgi:drug/metabolite transporter (DMT)-like permease
MLLFILAEKSGSERGFLMNTAWFLCAVVGLLWGIAPLIGRLSGVSAMTMATMIGGGTFLVTLFIAPSQDYVAAGAKGLLIALVAGIINGLGVLAFYRLVAGSGEGLWDASTVLTIAMVLVPIVIVIGARVFYGEELTAQRVVGLMLACGAIWLLR